MDEREKFYLDLVNNADKRRYFGIMSISYSFLRFFYDKNMAVFFWFLIIVFFDFIDRSH